MKKINFIALVLCAAMLFPFPVSAMADSCGKGIFYSAEAAGQKVKPGWVKVGNVYKWRQADGTIFAKRGWKVLGGRKYFLNSDGTRRVGWLKTKSGTYYLSQTPDVTKRGMVVTGKRWVKASDGKRHYFYFNKASISSASYGKKRSGVIKGSKYSYYFNSSGKLVTNKYGYKIGKYYYRINFLGVMKKLSEVEGLAGHRLDGLGPSLYNAFCWAETTIPYYSGYNHTPPKGVPMDVYYGLYGFKNKRGDCQVKACTFYWMAKALGYDAHYAKGTVNLYAGGQGPHGWVEIRKNGVKYIYDPSMSRNRSRYGITYDSPLAVNKYATWTIMN